MKYSLWKIEHENNFSVTAYKIKDTNSSKEVENWLKNDFENVASFFREEKELNAEYLQTFEN